MKAARTFIIVVGVSLFLFMAAHIVSAQTAITDQWFKGKATYKGYVISGSGASVGGKASGSGTVYLHIVDNSTSYTMTTCAEDYKVDNTWHRYDNDFPKSYIYGNPPDVQIWDIFNWSDPGLFFDVGAGGSNYVYTYPMFMVNYGKSISLKSIVCGVDNYAGGSSWVYGSCTMNFKSVDASKVPAGCQ